MRTAEQLPSIPNSVGQIHNPFVFRRTFIGNDAYVEVRTVAYGVAPIAVVRDGTLNLEHARNSLDDENGKTINEWIILDHETELLRRAGQPFTVYGGPGSFELTHQKAIVPTTAHVAEMANRTFDSLVEIGTEFISTLELARKS